MQTTTNNSATYNPELSANQSLAALGLTKRPVGSGYRYEYLRGSEVVHVGNVYTVSGWMAAGCPEQVEE